MLSKGVDLLVAQALGQTIHDGGSGRGRIGFECLKLLLQYGFRPTRDGWNTAWGAPVRAMTVGAGGGQHFCIEYWLIRGGQTWCSQCPKQGGRA